MTPPWLGGRRVQRIRSALRYTRARPGSGCTCWPATFDRSGALATGFGRPAFRPAPGKRTPGRYLIQIAAAGHGRRQCRGLDASGTRELDRDAERVPDPRSVSNRRSRHRRAPRAPGAAPDRVGLLLRFRDRALLAIAPRPAEAAPGAQPALRRAARAAGPPAPSDHLHPVRKRGRQHCIGRQHGRNPGRGLRTGTCGPRHRAGHDPAAAAARRGDAEDHCGVVSGDGIHPDRGRSDDLVGKDRDPPGVGDTRRLRPADNGNRRRGEGGGEPSARRRVPHPGGDERRGGRAQRDRARSSTTCSRRATPRSWRS